MATADTEDVEGNRKGARVEASEGAGYEVIVEREVHGGGFGGPERHKDWVHQHQASTPGREAVGRDDWLRRRRGGGRAGPPGYVGSSFPLSPGTKGMAPFPLFSFLFFSFLFYLTSFLCRTG